MQIKQNDNTTIFQMEYDSKFEQYFLLCSDIHIDSKYCKRNVFKRHLDEANDRNAKVIIAGDFFDCMQAKNDPRHRKSSLENIDIQETYFNSIINKTVDFCKPYKNIISLIGYGNHETAVMKHSEIDLLQMFQFGMSSNLLLGGYGGWIRFQFKGKNNTGKRHSYLLFYHHGSGSNAVMTKGLLNSVRASSFIPDADIIMTGHNHEQWLVKQERYRLNKSNNQYTDTQYLLKTPTYFDDSEKGFGFMFEKLQSPKPIGAWWLRFFHRGEQENKNGRIDFEIYEAK
jgi:predicted phosphodiesterase